MCPLCSRRFARKDHLQRHYYNCKRRYGVSNADDSVYVTAMVQAGMVNNNGGSSSSSQGQAGDTMETFNSSVMPIHRGRGRPRGSRNKVLGMALDGQSLNSQMGSNRGLSNDSLIKQALSKEVAKEVAKAERINHEMVINESVLNQGVFKESVNVEAHNKVMPINNNNNTTDSAEEESQDVVDEDENQEKESESSPPLSNDQAVLLPIYRAAKISSQVAKKAENNYESQSELQEEEPSSD